MFEKVVVIFGSTGMLGHTLTKYLKNNTNYQVIALTRKHYDVLNSDHNELVHLFKVFPPGSTVVNTIGLIPQTGNTNEDDYYKINAQFPKYLDDLCNLYNHKLIHITTDCVFNGLGNGNYTEVSIKDETNIYGKSKALGEELQSATIIRTSIIGDQLRNSNNEIPYKSLLEWVLSNEHNEIKGYTNHYWNGVTCLRLSEIIHIIIEKNLYWKGVSHIFSNTVSKYTLLNYIKDVYNLNIKIIPHECPQKIDKTLFSRHLTNTIINKYIGEKSILAQLRGSSPVRR